MIPVRRNSRYHRISTLMALVTLSIIACTSAVGQNPTPSPTPDPLADLKKLKEELETLKQIVGLQKDIAVAEADRATAEKNRILNALPQPTATPLTGQATVTNFTFENEILAYRSISHATDLMKNNITVASDSPLIIYNDGDIRALETYAATLSQIRAYNRAYKDTKMPGTAEAATSLLLAPQVASTFLRSVVDLVSLFRTDTKIEGLTITLDEEAVLARVANGLSSKFKVYRPSLLLPNTLGVKDDKLASDLLAGIYALQFNRTLAQSYATNKTVDNSTKEILNALNTEVGKFLTALTTDDATKRNPLAALFRAERLLTLFASQPEPYVLYLKYVKAGGSRITKTNLWKGSKLSETGGAAFAYTIFNVKGAVSKSGFCYAYFGSSSSSPEPVELTSECK